MATTQTVNVKKIIRAATVIAVLIMIVAIGWTAFFMMQILEIIPSFHGAAATETNTTEIESVNSSLLERVMEQLHQKTGRPIPQISDLKNPFIIPTEVKVPEPVPPAAPPAAPETPPIPAPPAE